MSAGKLLFVATEDWFVRSHFMPLLRRAREEGYEPIVAARVSGADLEGVRVAEIPFSRGSLDLWQGAREAAALHALVRRERPDLVHAIALRPVALCRGLEAPRVFAITGRGYLGARGRAHDRFVLARIAGRVRAAVEAGRAVLTVENDADRRWIEAGAALPKERVVLMPGAGVDAALFSHRPEPDGPLVVGVAARLVWSKGVDIVVDAVQRLRSRGVAVQLRVAGAPDASNKEQVSVRDLGRWSALPGVGLLGPVADISAFWAGAHIACLASRGGEGLPRSLIEAAACGRPAVTTATPGCADFVRDGETGLITPPNDAGALASALAQLAADGALRRRMGAAARARVLDGYTEAHAADSAARAWRFARARCTA